MADVNMKSGLVALVSSVRSYFEARNILTGVSLGWKEAAKQLNQGSGRANRVVFIPSDPSGKGGVISAAQQPGARHFGTDTTARALYTWERFVVVSIWAADTEAPNDEEAQIEAVETLFEETMRAVHAFAHNNARWGDVSWLASPLERQLGRELRASLVFKHPMFDSPTGVAYPTPIITQTLSATSG